MSEAKSVLAIGRYDAATAAAIEKAGWRSAASLQEALSLPSGERATIAAIAYKSHDRFDASRMDAFEALGLIANYGVGYDAIDVKAAASRGIAVTNTPDVLSDDVADLALALVLGLYRHLCEADGYVRAGRWAAEGPLPLFRSLGGGRAGIVGLGRIGSEIADRLAACKMQIHYHARAPKEIAGWQYHETIVEMAKAVDLLVVALPGGPQTRHKIDRPVLDALGADGLIVNISRGSTIDEEALIEALQADRIAGAGLDVFENEPHVDPRFFDLRNVILQPHQASATRQTRAAMGRLQHDNIAAFLKGEEPPTRVN